MSIRSLLYLNSFIITFGLIKKQKRQLPFLLLLPFFCNSQVANYITNGGFEDLYVCPGINTLNQAKGWSNIDSATFAGVEIMCACYYNMPWDGASYQLPEEGLRFGLATFLCQTPQCSSTSNRAYFRNRLKANLINGKIYCVKFYVNVRDNSSYGIANISAFFVDNSIDTITKCTIPLTYINPQINNLSTNFITDTMNWVPITGTFVANGTEKNCVIGNFKSDANTNKILINPAILPTIGCDILIDDVSCIPIDLPAYAGVNTYAVPGGTVYIGRPCDVGIDEACLWYNLTNTTTPIANTAGITVTVAATTQTYMVKQDICGVIKYDTVVVYASGVGLKDISYWSEVVGVYPNPANDKLYITVNSDNFTFNPDSYREGNVQLSIINTLGQIIREEEITLKENKATINIMDLCNGIYNIQITNSNGQKTIKKLVVAK